MEYDKTLSQVLEQKIKFKYKSVKKFSDISGIPYMTISNVLKRGVEKSVFGTVQKICEALEISIDALIRTRALDTIQRKVQELGDNYTDEDLRKDLIESRILSSNNPEYAFKTVVADYRRMFLIKIPII